MKSPNPRPKHGDYQTVVEGHQSDFAVPERKLAMTWSLRRKTDKSLPDVPLPRPTGRGLSSG
jgi:hypothetical protein